MSIGSITPQSRRTVIATADIETASDGKLLDVNLAFQEDGKEPEYFRCTSWKEWLDVCGSVINRVKIDRVWFHNGGRFDCVGLAVMLARGELDDQVEKWSPMLVGGTIIQLTIKLKGVKRALKIGDSFRLMTGSLNSLGESFGFGKKEDVPEKYKSRMQDFRRLHGEQYHAYHKRDTLLLLSVLQKFSALLNSVVDIGGLPLTGAAAALKIFKAGFLGKQMIYTPGRAERDYTRAAYQGGRCEFVGDGDTSGSHATFKGVRKYDVNSQYPSVMKDNLYPTEPGVFTRDPKLMRRPDGSIRPGVYHCRYRQAHGRIAIIKPRLDGEQIISDAEWQGEGRVTYIELNEIERRGGKVELIEGYFYTDECMKPLFKEFVDRMYALRLKAEKEGNAAMKYTIKILMNSLYGKFGQGETGDTYSVLTEAQLTEKLAAGAKVKDLGEEFPGNVYAVPEDIVVEHSFPAIAAFVTAHARLVLLRQANDHGVRIIYMDTDSIHTQDVLKPEFVGLKTLGLFKLESSEDGHIMAYGGKKNYVDVTEEYIKLKGCPVKKRQITEALKVYENGGKMKVCYDSPMGIKRAIAGGVLEPNAFMPYVRHMQRTPSSRRAGMLRAA